MGFDTSFSDVHKQLLGREQDGGGSSRMCWWMREALLSASVATPLRKNVLRHSDDRTALHSSLPLLKTSRALFGSEARSSIRGMLRFKDSWQDGFAFNGRCASLPSSVAMALVTCFPLLCLYP